MSRAGRGSSSARPVRILGPLITTALAVLVWAAIAHNSGSGWVQALGVLVGAVLLVALVGPAFALRGAAVRCVAGPEDAVCGSNVEIVLDSDRRLKVTAIGNGGRSTFVGPGTGKRGDLAAPHSSPAPGPHAPAPGSSRLVLVPLRRQVIRELELEIATCAPFGVQWWARRTKVALPQTLYVAPMPGASLPLPHRSGARQGDSPRAANSVSGDPRGIRPYRPGDSRRQVHWPATAHARQLMVRESETAVGRPSAIEVVLPGDPVAERQVSELAAGTIGALMRRGDSVTIISNDGSGPKPSPVRDRREAGRVLARAVAEADRAPGVWIR